MEGLAISEGCLQGDVTSTCASVRNHSNTNTAAITNSEVEIINEKWYEEARLRRKRRPAKDNDKAKEDNHHQEASERRSEFRCPSSEASIEEVQDRLRLS